MSTLFSANHGLKAAMLSGLLAVMCSLSAHAGLYPYTYTDTGPIPQSGGVFSVEHPISGIESSITSIELILTFNSSASLGGGIQGSLNLGTGGGSPFISFTPSASYSGTGSQVVYDATFSGLNGYNPNATWGLVLWDTSSTGLENGLAGWSLNITAVPEPVNLALGVFGVGALGVHGLRRWRARTRAT